MAVLLANWDAIRCIDGFNLCMTGNNLDDHLGDGVVIENTYGSVVSGNMIEECNGTAIVLDRDCYGITLSANVIAPRTSLLWGISSLPCNPRPSPSRARGPLMFC
jgi:hypothetical protein